MQDVSGPPGNSDVLSAILPFCSALNLCSFLALWMWLLPSSGCLYASDGVFFVLGPFLLQPR